MEFWKLIILFFSAFVGGAAVFLFKKANSQRLKLILSFSGAYLFAITILHLIPEVYQTGGAEIGLFVLGGFLLQIILEQFSDGIEHGHVHSGHHHQHTAFPYGIMISLCLHAFLEGMPIAKDEQQELVFGIAIHHIPAAFALASVLLQNHVSKRSVYLLLIVFAAMSPLGYWFSYGIGNGSIGDIEQYFDRIMAIVIGIFLHISTTILFESTVDHRYNFKKMIAVLLGLSFALMSFFLH